MQVRSELEQLLGRLAEGGWDYSDPTGELARFIELSRRGDELDAAIADLEAAVNAAPDDIQARLTLAEYYVGKLMTVAGPEQGLWGSKAESQWTQVLERDDKVWRAHHALGTNYSYYPSVMGKSDAAIEHLQTACELQRDLDPHPQHVQTYLFLSRMHSRDRNIEAARSTLEEGLDRHPGDAQLIAELDRLEH
jgi:tetratricopeptide (TPR) repeat protein